VKQESHLITNKLIRVLVYTLVFVLAFGLIAFFSYLLFIENNLKHIGLGVFFSKNVSLVLLLIILPFLVAYITFYIRKILVRSYYWYKSELSEIMIKRLGILDFIISALLVVFVLLNARYFFLASSLVDFRNLSFYQIADYPFLIKLFVVLVAYLTILLLWLILPVLRFSHKAYHVRFLPLRIVSHKFSLIVSLLFLLLLLFISLLVVSIGIDSFLDLSNVFLFQLGIISGILLIILSFFAFFRLLFNKVISTIWFYLIGTLNILVVVFYFFNVGHDIRVFSSSILEELFERMKNSPYVLKFETKKVDSVRFDLGSLRKLAMSGLSFYEESTNYPVIDYFREIHGFDKLYYSFLTGRIDSVFVKNLKVTNVLMKEDLEFLFPYSRIGITSYSNTNYITISYIYEFGGMRFFYDGGTILAFKSNTSGNWVTKFYKGDFDYPSRGLGVRDHLIVEMVMDKLGIKPYKNYFVQVINDYFLVPLGYYCLVISNKNYILYDVNEFVSYNEYPLVIGNIVVMMSNLYVGNELAGFKVRYFDLVGYGATLNEAILSMIGNADYYYKVQELERRMKSLRSFIEENTNRLDPLIIKDIMTILSY
jgi:hypothetical protein